jgi:chromosome segregation ATPase
VCDIFKIRFSVSISEARGVEEKIKTERFDLLCETQVLGTEVDSLRSQINRLHEELKKEREYKNILNREKLSVESHSAELNLLNMRLEASVEDAKLKHRILEVECDKKRQQLDLMREELEKSTSELVACRDTMTALSQRVKKLSAEVTSGSNREKELTNEMHVIRKLKDDALQELGVNRTLVASMRLLIDDKNKEIEDLTEKIDAVRSECEASARSAQMSESKRVEDRYADLRSELEEANHQVMAQAESAKSISLMLDTERESNHAFKLRIAGLEERLYVTQQELEMFRSLDVYRISMQSELKRMRSLTESNTDIDASGTAKSSHETSLQGASIHHNRKSAETSLQSRLTLKDLDTKSFRHEKVEIGTRLRLDESVLGFNSRQAGLRPSRSVASPSTSISTSAAGLSHSTSSMPSKNDIDRAKRLLLATHR